MSSKSPETTAPPNGRRRLWPRSFRAQVTLWNTLTILLFTLAILIGLRSGLTWMMLREEDKLLSEDTAEVSLIVVRFAPNWNHVQDELERKSEVHEPRKWFSQIRDSKGHVLAQSTGIPDIQLVTPSLATQSIADFRVAYKRIQLEGGAEVLTIVGATTEEIEEDVGRLTRLILFVSFFLVVAAPFGGFWLAGRVIRPLAAIISMTANLRPSNIHERLPIRRTGDELDQLSETINGLLDRIADYLARHRDLTANAAHELRSPLAAILSSAEVALNQDRTTEEYKELLGSIAEECTRLGTLVHQLLLLAESDAGRLERKHERVELAGLTRRAVEMFQGVAESRGIRLEAQVDKPVWIMGDAGQLRQVIFNVIDNALKFTPSGFVRVEVKTDVEGNGLIVVADSGVGIPPENLPFIFDRFYRGDHARTRMTTGGSGLGLSICKALLNASGGTISVDSHVGQGTEVRIRLGRPID